MNNIINQIIEMENKSKEHQVDLFSRNFKRILHELEEQGFKVVNPIGETYDSRDASLEANILNEDATVISRVLKPAIYKLEENSYVLIQKGIVIVE